MANIKAFLDELVSNPKAAELLKGKGEPKSEEEKIKAILEVGKELGYALTADELTAALKEKGEALKARTDAQASEVEKLDDDDLAQASGGKKEHSNCKDTFRDRENCWLKDGCDIVNIRYDDYVCHYTQQLCDNNQAEQIIKIIPELIP